MQALICEMCNSHDIVKQDGLYVCQSCGTKYSIEEAKRMFQNGMTVQIDRGNEIENRVNNAINEYNSGNYDVAFNLFSDVLNIDPNNYRAIIYKGICSGWKSTMTSFTIGITEKEILRAIPIFSSQVKNSFDYSLESVVYLSEVMKLGAAIRSMIDRYDKGQNEIIKNVLDVAEEQRQRGVQNTGIYTVDVARVYLEGAMKTLDRANTIIKSSSEKSGKASFEVCGFMHMILCGFLDGLKNPEDACAEYYDICSTYLSYYKNCRKDSVWINTIEEVTKYIKDGKQASIEKQLGISAIEDNNVLTEKMSSFINEEKWDYADACCNKMLSIMQNQNKAVIYYYKLLIENKCKDVESVVKKAIIKKNIAVLMSSNYYHALDENDDNINHILREASQKAEVNIHKNAVNEEKETKKVVINKCLNIIHNKKSSKDDILYAISELENVQYNDYSKEIDFAFKMLKKKTIYKVFRITILLFFIIGGIMAVPKMSKYNQYRTAIKDMKEGKYEEAGNKFQRGYRDSEKYKDFCDVMYGLEKGIVVDFQEMESFIGNMPEGIDSSLLTDTKIYKDYKGLEGNWICTKEIIGGSEMDNPYLYGVRIVGGQIILQDKNKKYISTQNIMYSGSFGSIGKYMDEDISILDYSGAGDTDMVLRCFLGEFVLKKE